MVRKAHLNDLESVAQLFDLYRVFYGKASDMAGARKFLSDRMAGHESVIYVAISDDQEMMGFVQLYPVFSSTRMKRLWLLNDLFVEEKFRGMGVSVQLIDAAKQLCHETDACGLLLETAKSNVIGNQLYPRTGFELDGDHHYYSWDR